MVVYFHRFAEHNASLNLQIFSQFCVVGIINNMHEPRCRRIHSYSCIHPEFVLDDSNADGVHCRSEFRVCVIFATSCTSY